MNDILVTGRGTSGSWLIRGEQLGHAIGATVVTAALNMRGFSAAILVKRPSAGLIERLHRATVPIIFDIVDAYPQPAALDWTRDQCMAWLRAQVQEIRPVALVAATQAMARDCQEFGLPTLYLPHHSRPGQAQAVIHREVRKVGYEGAEHYLGAWLPHLQEQCARRGWQFLVNPAGGIATLDIVVALRNATGYAAQQWKSGVKVSNAVGAGVPCIFGDEAGCAELFPLPPIVDVHQLEVRMDMLERFDVRKEIAGLMGTIAPALTLDAVAARYREWLCKLSF